MSSEVSYCPMTGTFCSYAPHEVEVNSYFLIQPFDGDKSEREEAIDFALRRFYGEGRYRLEKSDSSVHLQASYCDICLKIRSCQYCIVDISGEIFKVLIGDEIKEKLFFRPNIPFELGLAYGFDKPAIILFRKLANNHKLPSDLDFIRYFDITAQNWSMISQRLLDQLRESPPHRAILSNICQEVIDIASMKAAIKSTIYLKENFYKFKFEGFKINQIIFKNNRFYILIVKNTKHLINGLCFNLYITLDQIETKRGVIRIESVNREKGMAQAEFVDINDHEDYWASIAKNCSQKAQHTLGDHRLEAIIPEEFNKLDLLQMKELQSILDMCG
jgi:hypothetical protein